MFVMCIIIQIVYYILFLCLIVYTCMWLHFTVVTVSINLASWLQYTNQRTYLLILLYQHRCISAGLCRGAITILCNVYHNIWYGSWPQQAGFTADLKHANTLNIPLTMVYQKILNTVGSRIPICTLIIYGLYMFSCTENLSKTSVGRPHRI